MKTEAELTSADWDLVHRYRNSRALLRRERVTARLRAQLEQFLPDAEREAAERGIPPELLRRWRAYPSDGDLGVLEVRGDVTAGRGYVVERLPRGRKRKSEPSRSSTRPADAMAALEARLTAALRAGGPPAPARASDDLESQLAASLRAVGIDPAD